MAYKYFETFMFWQENVAFAFTAFVLLDIFFLLLNNSWIKWIIKHFKTFWIPVRYSLNCGINDSFSFFFKRKIWRVTEYIEFSQKLSLWFNFLCLNCSQVNNRKHLKFLIFDKMSINECYIILASNIELHGLLLLSINIYPGIEFIISIMPFLLCFFIIISIMIKGNMAKDEKA